MREKERELIICAQNGNFDRMSALVDQGVAVDCADFVFGATPLVHAVHGLQSGVARYLLEKGANVSSVDEEGRNPLFYAIRRGSVPLLRLLVEYGANIEASCSKDCSPLSVAIFYGNVDMVVSLLELGAKTDETLYHGCKISALSVACLYKKAGAVRLLIAHNDGADVNTVSIYRGWARSPLCWSCAQNSFEITEILLENDARVIYPIGDPQDIPNPLWQAVHQGSLDLLRLVLANVQERDPVDQLDLALKGALLQSKLEFAEVLVKHGANVNSFVVFCGCAHEGLCEAVLFLLQQGADANITDGKGQTPLWIAAEKGNEEMVLLLLGANADTGIASSAGETPFAVAQRNEHVGVVYLLLRGMYDSVGRAELCGKSLFELITGGGKQGWSAL